MTNFSTKIMNQVPVYSQGCPKDVTIIACYHPRELEHQNNIQTTHVGHILYVLESYLVHLAK